MKRILLIFSLLTVFSVHSFAENMTQTIPQPPFPQPEMSDFTPPEGNIPPNAGQNPPEIPQSKSQNGTPPLRDATSDGDEAISVSRDVTTNGEESSFQPETQEEKTTETPAVSKETSQRFKPPFEKADNFFEQSGMANTETVKLPFWKEYFTPILSVVILALAFLFVIFYKRKQY